MKKQYKVGEKVWSTLNDEKEQIKILSIGTNRLGIKMFTLEGFENLSVGPNHIKRKLTDRYPTLGECLSEDDAKYITKTSINTFANILNSTPYFKGNENVEKWQKDTDQVFFNPKYDFAKWFAEYANGRVIVEVGCGVGHFLRYMKGFNARVAGIEPRLDGALLFENQMKLHGEEYFKIINKHVEDCANIIKGFGNKGILVIANPTLPSFVKATMDMLDDDTELIVITRPEYKKKLYRLGSFVDITNSVVGLNTIEKQLKKKVTSGVGDEGESIFSFIKSRI